MSVEAMKVDEVSQMLKDKGVPDKFCEVFEGNIFFATASIIARIVCMCSPVFCKPSLFYSFRQKTLLMEKRLNA